MGVKRKAAAAILVLLLFLGSLWLREYPSESVCECLVLELCYESMKSVRNASAPGQECVTWCGGCRFKRSGRTNDFLLPVAKEQTCFCAAADISFFFLKNSLWFSLKLSVLYTQFCCLVITLGA